MAIYFKDKEITNIDSLIPQIGLDITDIWFGDTNIYTVWQVYEGTLPATLNANGTDMHQYQLYGNTGGVGDTTENIWNVDETVQGDGYISNALINNNDSITTDITWAFVSEYIPILPNTTYGIFTNLFRSSKGAQTCMCFYDASKNFLSYASRPSVMSREDYSADKVTFFTTPADAAYLRVSVDRLATQNYIFKGTTPPENYVPYGYKFPMVVFDGYQIYDDVLPAQISANGMDFKNYRLFGATGGVGDRTVQLFDPNAKNPENGYMTNTFLYGENYGSSEDWAVSEYIDISGLSYITLYRVNIAAPYASVVFYTNNHEYISAVAYAERVTFSTSVPQNAQFCRISVRKERWEMAAVISGNIAPATYIPFGYEVDILTEKPIIYGFHINPNDSNPYTAVTYLKDAVGKTPAAMGSTAFSYGNWANAFFMPRPCMLKYDGTVDYYLNPNDYSQKADGTPSDYNNLAYGGNAMMEFPLIWYKFVQGAESGEGYFYCSNRKVDDSYKCFSNLDCDGNIIEHFYMPIYNGCTYDGKMRSISGLQLSPWSTTAYSSSSTYAVDSKVNYQGKMWKCTTAVETVEAFDPAKWEQFAFNGQTTGTEEIAQATANNTTAKVEWYTNVLCDRQLINALLVLLSKSLDTQGSFGRGIDSGDQAAKEAYVTGSLDNKGLFYGSTANGNTAVKVFGMENWWACVWHRTAGLIGGLNSTYLYKMTYSTADGSTADGYNTDGTGYLSIGNKPTASNYIKKMQYGLWGCLPIETDSYSTQYFKDYYIKGTNYALFGGFADYGAAGGAFCTGLHSSVGNRHWAISSDLSCKPCRTGNLSKNLEAATVTPIYIGDTALQKDEYIDYKAGKVYRRTENELNNRLITNNYPGTSLGNIQLSVKPNTPYTLKTNCPRYDNGALICLDIKRSGSTTSDNGAWDGQTRTITSTSDGVLYVRYRGNNSEYDLTSYSYMLTEGTTPPETYVPYLTPTDPPVALPALPTAEGEMIVDYAGQSIVPSSFYGKYINNPIIPIYIGDTALQKDEYVDYKEQKVYRVNPNDLFDGTILNGYYTNADFDLSTSQSSLRDFRSFKLFLPAGTYSLCFNKLTFIARRIINGVMDITHPVIAHIVFTCESDSYVGFSYRLYNDIPGDNPDVNFVVISGTKYEFLSPTDPPVALPALPTCDGETNVDYVGESVAPEKVAFKYRKKNF